MTQTRTMLSFRTGVERFNYRVAGIALRNDHVLVCREDDDSHVMLPGGRVEFGEFSREALRREIAEEIRFPADIGAHVFTAENFFARGGEKFHEIGHYFRMELDPTFPFSSDGVCHRTFDEGHDLQFSWVPVSISALAAVNLLPGWLAPRLSNLPESTEHVISDER